MQFVHIGVSIGAWICSILIERVDRQELVYTIFTAALSLIIVVRNMSTVWNS